jgi:hypothetical protein
VCEYFNVETPAKIIVAMHTNKNKKEKKNTNTNDGLSRRPLPQPPGRVKFTITGRHSVSERPLIY